MAVLLARLGEQYSVNLKKKKNTILVISSPQSSVKVRGLLGVWQGFLLELPVLVSTL